MVPTHFGKFVGWCDSYCWWSTRWGDACGWVCEGISRQDHRSGEDTPQSGQRLWWQHDRKEGKSCPSAFPSCWLVSPFCCVVAAVLLCCPSVWTEAIGFQESNYMEQFVLNSLSSQLCAPPYLWASFSQSNSFEIHLGHYGFCSSSLPLPSSNPLFRISVLPPNGKLNCFCPIQIEWYGHSLYAYYFHITCVNSPKTRVTGSWETHIQLKKLLDFPKCAQHLTLPHEINRF